MALQDVLSSKKVTTTNWVGSHNIGFLPLNEAPRIFTKFGVQRTLDERM